MQGNRTIEDITELMKRITFRVWKPYPFLEHLPIVTQAKVKSIFFKNTFSSKEILKLTSAIGQTVEKVEFALNDESSKVPQRQLFVLILQECTNLRELIINSEREQEQKRPAFLSQSAEKIGFMANIEYTVHTTAMELPRINTIRSVSAYMECFQKRDVNGLVQVLLLLPKLN